MLELIKAYASFIYESKLAGLSFKEFAQARLEGATKITDAAKATGGPALLTYHHFRVKLPYYKRATGDRFDPALEQEELTELIKELAAGTSNGIRLGEIEFQKIVGKIEVIGELLIRSQDK